MTIKDKLAVIAHDGRKADLIAWATYNRERLSRFELVATASTGALLRGKVGLDVESVLSGQQPRLRRSESDAPTERPSSRDDDLAHDQMAPPDLLAGKWHPGYNPRTEPPTRGT